MENEDSAIKISSKHAALLLLGTSFLVYLNAFYGDFQFDDYNVIVNYRPIHSLSGCWKDMLRGIRPVLKLTYSLNWITDGGLFGYHLVNISIHAINGLLVFYLVRLFSISRVTGNTSVRQLASLIAALIFVLHPLQTEAVTYISGRSSSLMALFYLGSLCCYICGSKSNSIVLKYFLSPILFVIAVATKEVAVTLPATLLLWEVYAEKERWKVIFFKQIVHWFLLLVIALIFALKPSYNDLLMFAFTERSLYENMLTQINAITYLISRLLWLGHLNIDPDLPVIHEWDFLTVIQLSFLVGTFLFLILNKKCKPWWRFGALWFLLHLLPTNSIVPRLDVVNERQMYLAMVGMVLPLSLELDRLYCSMPTCRAFMKPAIGLMLIMLGVFTVNRNRDYYSEIALWEDTSNKSPYKARVFNNLGVAYETYGYYDKAYMSYLRAIQLDPGYDIAKSNINKIASKK